MPDTMLPTTAAAEPASLCGVMDGYRSPSIGKLVLARAKATQGIKSIVKDLKADIPNKNGGRGYQYSYADLASVMGAIEDAISAQGLAIFQTTQTRATGLHLITTLGHESDQWICAEMKLKADSAGPQVLGSEMTYMRRYAVLSILALAPEQDDDGKAAQDRADQRPRQEHSKPAPRPMPAPAPVAPSAPEQTASDDEPKILTIQQGAEGPLIGRWTKQALEILDGKPLAWRQRWMNLHEIELAEVKWVKPEFVQRIEVAANAPDLPEAAE
jgi:hypothetical protein